MKTIFKVLFLLLIGFVTKAQLPSNFPLVNSKGWYELGYIKTDSGAIIATRDTLWTPRFAGTMVMWQRAGIDTAMWHWTGSKWVKDLITGDGAVYLASNGITLSSSTFKLGGYLIEHTTVKGALRAYDLIFDSVRNLRITNANTVFFQSASNQFYLDDGSLGYSYFGNYPTSAYFYTTNSGSGTTIMSLADLKLTKIILSGADSSATLVGKTIRIGNSSNVNQNVYFPNFADATGDSVLAVNSLGKLVNRKISASSSVQFGKVEFVAEANSATYQNDSFIGRQILGVWIEGAVIGSTARSGANYYTFNSTTGTITFNNGIIAEDDNVLIYFGTASLTAAAGVLDTFTPADISGLLAWYDFTDATSLTLSSGRISQANDLSGNGNHVVQATFGNMPDYDATGGGQMSFTAARSADIKKTLGAAVTGNYTLYLLVRKKSSETFVNSAEMFVTNSGTVTGLIEKTSSWGDGLWSGYDGTNSTNAVVFRSSDYELFRVSFMQGNAVQFHVNDEAPSRTFYTGALPGSFPSINRYHFGRLSALGSDFSIKEAIAVADDANVDTDKAVWNYMRAKHGLTSKQYVLLIGDSHTFGSQSGSGGTTGNPFYLTLGNALGYRTYNDGINGSKAYDPAAPTDPDDFHTIVDTWMANGNPATGWVVISYGTNDLAADIALSSWKTNFKADIQKFITAGYNPQRIILWTPPYTTNPGYSANVNAAATKIAEIASELGCRLADVRQAMITAGLDCYTVVGGDGIHGNDAIHAVIKTTIQAQIY